MLETHLTLPYKKLKLKLYFCTVKLLTFLFAFYILLLPCIPCTDKAECDNDSKTETPQSTNHQKHQHNEEACSPFCNCACCGQTLLSSLNLTKNIIAKPLLQQKQQYCYNNITLTSNFFGNIWQPPKNNV